ncbi:MAG: hypothetical protein IPL29_02565 [Propionivibrio sp.]|nr:hypothetical protein [Propionivibrio sp.]
MKPPFIWLALLLSGCASLQNAGTAEYSVKPFVDTAGRVLCCDVTVKTAKKSRFLMLTSKNAATITPSI